MIEQYTKRMRKIHMHNTNVLSKMADILKAYSTQLVDIFFLSEVNEELFENLLVNQAR